MLLHLAPFRLYSLLEERAIEGKRLVLTTFAADVEAELLLELVKMAA